MFFRSRSLAKRGARGEEGQAVTDVLVALLIAGTAQVALVAMTFELGRRRGLLALVFPPFALVGAFLPPAQRSLRLWAAVAVGVLLVSASWTIVLFRGYARAWALTASMVPEHSRTPDQPRAPDTDAGGR